MVRLAAAVLQGGPGPGAPAHWAGRGSQAAETPEGLCETVACKKVGVMCVVVFTKINKHIENN